MSSRDRASTFQASQETAVSPSAAFARQRSDVGKDVPPRIRPLHVLILGGLMAFGPLSVDMYLPSLPSLSRDLNATMSQAQLSLSAAILGLSFGQLLSGPLSDALGRRRPLLIGLAAYVLASLLCIIAPSVAVLTALRFVQGVAGAAGIVIAMSVARDLYAGVALARFLSLLMLVNGLAPIVAPVIGSQLLTFTNWRGVFAALAIIGLVMLLGSAYQLRETLPPSQRQNSGFAASLGAFRDLLDDRRFMGYAASSGFAFAAAVIYISVSPFVLQNAYHLSPQFFGLIFAINALGLVIASQVSGRLVGRVSPHTLLTWGIAGITLGGVSLLLVAMSGVGLAGVLLALFVLVASLGLIMPNAATLALTDVRAVGSASALLGVLQFAIGAIAAPLVGIAGSATAIPMAVAISAFSLVALGAFLVFGRPARQESPLPTMQAGDQPAPFPDEIAS